MRKRSACRRRPMCDFHSYAILQNSDLRQLPICSFSVCTAIGGIYIQLGFLLLSSAVTVALIPRYCSFTAAFLAPSDSLHVHSRLLLCAKQTIFSTTFGRSSWKSASPFKGTEGRLQKKKKNAFVEFSHHLSKGLLILRGFLAHFYQKL